MVRLIDDLLDVSRITNGKIDLRLQRTSISEVIASARELALPLLEQHGHQLVVTLPAEELVLPADPQRLAQAVANLLTNAAKYSPPQSRIDLIAERRGSRAVVRVRDPGIGIPTEMLPRVFDLFVQLPQGKDRAQGGLGLGLAIVKNLLELHGGTATAHSEGLGKGSEFVLELPLAGEPLPQPIKDSAAAPALHRASSRILLVDDNEDALLLLAESLSLLGHEVRTASDGPSALQLAETFQPQIGLLDIGLPGMDGYELARRLRTLMQTEPFLVALSGYGQESDRTASRAAGFALHLVKPVELETLERVIANRQ